MREAYSRRRAFGLVTGPLLFLLLLIVPRPEGMTSPARAVAAVAALMAVWWISEAIPIPATALLPIVLFPLLGVMTAADVTRPYAHHLIFLFLGGFLIALSMERWQLHRRLALHIVQRVGTGPDRLVLGFMLATAFLSMWVSNTATTMMMVTIALAVLKHTGGNPSSEGGFGTALMLGIAYAASIGGVATLIGTPPNAILAGVMESTLKIHIGFAGWMLFAFPLSVLMLFFTWWYLTHRVCRLDSLPDTETGAELAKEVEEMGVMSRAEWSVALVFAAVAALWITHGLIDWRPLKQLKDSTIAMGGALLLFILPSGERCGGFLLDWQTAARLPWDVLLLFGGGFALAAGFSESGLTGYLARQLNGLAGLPVWLILGLVSLMVTFLTELTSNTATASLLLPLMVALAEAVGVRPAGLMVAAALSASCAFMLPVATPPNAIVFSSRCITVPQMARAGLTLNLVGALLITLFVYLHLYHPTGWIG